MPVAVQDQPASAPKAIEQLAAALELGRERPAEKERQPFSGMLLGKRHDVVVERDDGQVVTRRLVERRVDGVQVPGQQDAVTRDP